ncbi:hypothetical protein GLW08_04700 [Pontibacillus yanchengensis]|uniref:Uncharacterized protein n=1 Tax=Pontibacillus yanchengensis TaxID=462910 RepID=A0ACC7VEQ8_9BACI|nr:hypothetical protein [Pontibacillus yanchengensis]MYL52634.1 hypothetical protein [Pontibacillus yanchengensis]
MNNILQHFEYPFLEYTHFPAYLVYIRYLLSLSIAAWIDFVDASTQILYVEEESALQPNDKP